MNLENLAGGGGTERYFADVYHSYDRVAPGAFDLFFLSDSPSLRHLEIAGREISGARVIRFDIPITHPAGIRALCKLCHEADIQLLHIPLASPIYLPFLWFLGSGFGSWHPHISITMPDCSLSYTWSNPIRCRSNAEAKTWALYRIYFHTVKLDGVFCWYKRFVERVGSKALRGRPFVKSADYCFVDTERFQPAQKKRKVILFAARLTRVKRPLLFVDGIAQAIARSPNLFEGWEVAIYGRGELKPKLAQRLSQLGIDHRVTLTAAPQMAPIFSESCLFVSTQDYENFTSLSMLEAMAAGNVVIARDVGQTREFVSHGKNGYLVANDTPEQLADALIAYLSQPDRHAAMAVESRRIAVDHHNARNALQDLDRFWLQTLDRSGS